MMTARFMRIVRRHMPAVSPMDPTRSAFIKACADFRFVCRGKQKRVQRTPTPYGVGVDYLVQQNNTTWAMGSKDNHRTECTLVRNDGNGKTPSGS